MKAYTLTDGELTEIANDSIEAYLGQLKVAKVITEEEFTNLSQYKVVIAQPKFFGRLWERVTGGKSDKSYMTIVKIIGEYKRDEDAK